MCTLVASRYSRVIKSVLPFFTDFQECFVQNEIKVFRRGGLAWGYIRLCTEINGGFVSRDKDLASANRIK